MLSITDISLRSLATHYVGNEAAGDILQLSDEIVPLDNTTLKQLLLQYFLTPFKEAASYNFYHPTDLALNEIAHFATKIFEAPDTLLAESRNIAKHLYDITTLPQIKSGELHVAYFSGVPINGRMTDAIGIYKTESKQQFLKISDENGHYTFSPDEGINPEKMGKGCLIFNTGKDDGYLLHIVDRSAKGGEAQFWKDQFLKVRAADDAYHATEDYIRMSKDFIVQGLPAEYEVERVQQIDMLNKSADYFKKNEQFSQRSFEEEVFGQPEVIQSFKKYSNEYGSERDLSFEDGFEISGAAVKKNARVMKSVLKLDKNFHVYVHGARERIERGYDEQTGLNYYKIYFEEES